MHVLQTILLNASKDSLAGKDAWKSLKKSAIISTAWPRYCKL